MKKAKSSKILMVNYFLPFYSYSNTSLSWAIKSLWKMKEIIKPSDVCDLLNEKQKNYLFKVILLSILFILKFKVGKIGNRL